MASRRAVLWRRLSALLPCRHWCVCDACFAHLAAKCPVCRAEFSDVLRVHYARS